MPVPDPIVDPARLSAVAELGVGDGPQLEEFARLNRLAQRLLGVPVSIVSVISDSRQIHASQAGLVEDETSHSEWPLSHSFCKHVAASGEALIVSDARQDPLVSGNLSVRDHDVIAYAGFPLRMTSGEAVGAFCAIDHQPRQWTGKQLEILKDLTGVAISMLEHRRLVLGNGTRDLVTGLARPSLFAEQLTELLTRGTVRERIAVVALDLAEFGLLNDAWGHDAGDAVLSEVGLRLEQIANARRIRGRVCRLAGDTFLLAASLDASEPRGQLEATVLAAITGKPFKHDGEPHTIGARVVTITAVGAAPASELMQAASTAIGEARAIDASAPRTPTAPGPAIERLMIRNRLAGAETRGEMTLAYQPIYDLATSKISGTEALLRWTHPQLGIVPPNDFIPVAESNGAIVAIGEWVLQTALADLARWRGSHPNLALSVNVAPEQLLTGAFPHRIRELLVAAGVPADALTLEITERTLGHNLPALKAAIEQLRADGVQLSLDDFGTGYSSIERLAASPLDELKIDRSFTAALDTHPRHSALVAGIATMSAALDMRVVAEGIETAQQLNALISLGATHGQGYHLARPTTADHITELLAAQAAAF